MIMIIFWEATICALSTTEAISVGADDLPELCSSVYSFALNKTVQLLWQLKVYRVYLKKSSWQFVCINLHHK